MEKAPSQVTVSIPFIFLKPRGRSSANPKKAQFPVSFSGLLKVCKKLFQGYGEVRSIWSTDGELVQRLEDIIPGSTYLVSSIDPDMKPVEALRPVSLEEKPRLEPVFSSESYNRLFGSAQAEGALSLRKADEGSPARKQFQGGKRRRRESPGKDEAGTGLERSASPARGRCGNWMDASEGSLARSRASAEVSESGDGGASVGRGKGSAKRRLGMDVSEGSVGRERRRGDEDGVRRGRSARNEETPDAVETPKRRRGDEDGVRRGRIARNEEVPDAVETPNRRKDGGTPKRTAQSRESRSLTPSGRRMNGSRAGTPTTKKRPMDAWDDASDEQEELGGGTPKGRRGTPVRGSGMGRSPGRSSAVRWGNRTEDTYSEDDDHSMERQDSPGGRQARDQERVMDVGALMGLINGTIGEGSMDSKARNAFAKSELWVQELLSAAPQYEQQHEQIWFHKGHEMFSAQSIPADTEICGYEDISKFCQSVISSHRFIHAGGVDYNMQVAIVGPRQSGKSHILSVFADEVMLEFAMNGLWKKTFFMFVNFSLLTPFVSDLAEFYHHFVDDVLGSLVWQRPILEKWLSRLRAFFLSATTSKSCPRLPINSKFYQDNPHLALALQKVVAKLWEFWNDPCALSQWMSTVFLLPSLIAEASGFQSVFYFIDNLDYADLDLFHPAPFTESKNHGFVVEYLKFAIRRGNFVVTSEDQTKLQELLTQVEVGGTDLYHSLHIVSPLNVITEPDQRSVKIDVQGEKVPFNLTIDHCCGIPAYVALWKELNDAIDNINLGDIEEDERQMLTHVYAQHLLDTIFCLPNNEPVFVTGVRR